MKRYIAIALALMLMCTGLLAGCNTTQNSNDTATQGTLTKADIEKEILAQAEIFTSKDSKQINKLFYSDENIPTGDNPLYELESLARYEGVGINTLCKLLGYLTIEVTDVTDTDAVYKISAPDMSNFFNTCYDEIAKTAEDSEITPLINSYGAKADKRDFDVTLSYSITNGNTVKVNYQTRAFADALTGGLVSLYEFQYEAVFYEEFANTRSYPVKDAFAQTTPNNNKSVKYRIPEIQVDKGDAPIINKTIFDKYKTLIENSNPEHNDENVTLVNYEWGQREDVLTVIITTEIDYMHRTYEAYYISLKSGKGLAEADVIKAAGFTDEQFAQNVKDASESAFWQSLELESNKTDNEDFANLVNSTLDLMHADSTLAEESVPYISRTGELWAVTRVYSIAGADRYIKALNVENFQRSEFLGLTME